MIRDDAADLVFRDEKAKFNALIDEIVEMQEAGGPFWSAPSASRSPRSSPRCSSGEASSTRP